MTMHEIIDELELPSSRDVYAPAEDTYLLLDYFDSEEFHKDFLDNQSKMNLFAKKSLTKNSLAILDMGCGTGILGFCFAVKSIRMFQELNQHKKLVLYSIDNNPTAVEYTRLFCEKNFQNLKTKKLVDPSGTIEFFPIQSDLLNCFYTTKNSSQGSLNRNFQDVEPPIFDYIIFNPPYLPSEKELIGLKNEVAIDAAWDGGDESGNLILLRFFSQVRDFMSQDTEIFFVTSSHADVGSLLKTLASMGFETFLLQSIHIFFEDIMLFKAVSAK